MSIYKECDKGWDKLIDPLIERCAVEGVEILQIKEKFGGLRFYIGDGASDELYNMIEAAENASYETCEVCGNPGTRRSDGWIKTMCDQDWEKRLIDRKNRYSNQ